MVLPSAITPMTRSPTLSGAHDQRPQRRALGDPARVGVDVVDDLADAAGGDRADDAVAAAEPGQARQLVAEAGDRRRARRSPRRAACTAPSVATIRWRASLQRELRDALDVEQRRQLLREAVDQVDLAVEVQHLGAERLALDLLGRPGDRAAWPRPARPAGPRTQPSGVPSWSTGKARGAAGAAASPASSRPSRSSTATGAPSAAASASTTARAPPWLPTTCLVRRGSRAAHRPSTSRAFSSSASGSNGLVM